MYDKLNVYAQALLDEKFAPLISAYILTIPLVLIVAKPVVVVLSLTTYVIVLTTADGRYCAAIPAADVSGKLATAVCRSYGIDTVTVLPTLTHVILTALVKAPVHVVDNTSRV